MDPTVQSLELHVVLSEDALICQGVQSLSAFSRMPFAVIPKDFTGGVFHNGQLMRFNSPAYRQPIFKS